MKLRCFCWRGSRLSTPPAVVRLRSGCRSRRSSGIALKALMLPPTTESRIRLPPVLVADRTVGKTAGPVAHYPSAKPSRLKVAVDVDEVLGQFLVALNLFVRDQYGMRHILEDYHVYHFATIWGCSQEFANHIVHEFFKSPHFRQLPLVPGALDALRTLQKWCDLCVVTSRQHVIREMTTDWLSVHFPGIFTDIHFANHFALEGNTRKKSEICKEIAADVLIDDNPEYAVDCATAGINVLLYNWKKGYPWSILEKRHSRIREVHAWSDIPIALREFLIDDQANTKK